MGIFIKRGMAYLLIAIGVASLGGAIYGIVKLLSKGYTYACVGQGCPYQTPGAVPWIYFATIGLPVGIFALIGGFILRGVSRNAPAHLGPVSQLASSWGPPPGQDGASVPGASGFPPTTPGSAAAPLVSSYVAGEPGPTPTVGQDILGTSNFRKKFRNVYLGTAVFELVLASAFIAGAIAFPAPRVGFILTGVILGAVGLGLLVAGRKSHKKVLDAERLKVSGLRGTAQIVGLEQTGMWVNNNPMVGIDALVTVPGKAPYRVRKRELVPQIQTSALSGGNPVNVLVDPEDAGNVLFPWDLG